MLQKKAIRIVCNVSYVNQSNVLFLELHVLKVFDLIELKIAMIMYKTRKKYLLTVNIRNKFNMRLVLAYDTRQSKNIRQVFARPTQIAIYIWCEIGEHAAK